MASVTKYHIEVIAAYSVAIEINRALDHNFGKQCAELRDLVRMSLGARLAPGGLTILGVEAEGLVGEFLERLQGKARYEDLPAPEATT